MIDPTSLRTQQRLEKRVRGDYRSRALCGGRGVQAGPRWLSQRGASRVRYARIRSLQDDMGQSVGAAGNEDPPVCREVLRDPLWRGVRRGGGHQQGPGRGGRGKEGHTFSPYGGGRLPVPGLQRGPAAEPSGRHRGQEGRPVVGHLSLPADSDLEVTRQRETLPVRERRQAPEVAGLAARPRLRHHPELSGDLGILRRVAGHQLGRLRLSAASKAHLYICREKRGLGPWGKAVRRRNRTRLPDRAPGERVPSSRPRRPL